MANPDRETVYTNDGVNRNIYTRESNSTGWFVGIIVALALLAIAYLVYSANTQPASVTVDNSPAITTPAPAETAPMTPTDTLPAPVETAPMSPADTTPAPADTTVTPVPAEPTPVVPAQ